MPSAIQLEMHHSHRTFAQICQVHTIAMIATGSVACMTGSGVHCFALVLRPCQTNSINIMSSTCTTIIFNGCTALRRHDGRSQWLGMVVMVGRLDECHLKACCRVSKKAAGTRDRTVSFKGRVLDTETCTRIVMPLYGENDDSDNSDGSTSSGDTRLEENQMLAESQPSDQPSRRQPARANKGLISRTLAPAVQRDKPVKPKKKAFHAPYQKLTPILTDDIQNVDMEASGCVTASARNSTCVDVP
ncbi:hypothetical protein BDR06DRAFT_978018, partial [Suillus hirtellus]